jgi:hypothetical protein
VKLLWRACLLLVICEITLLGSYKTLDHFSPSKEKYRIEQLLNKKDRINALAIGTSHNLALDFEKLGLDGYTIWQGGQDLFEMEYQLKSLVPLLKNLKIVFMNISYSKFQWDCGAVTKGRVAYPEALYNKVLKRNPQIDSLLIKKNWVDNSGVHRVVYFDLDEQPRTNIAKLPHSFKNYGNRRLDNLSTRRRNYYYYIPSTIWVNGDFFEFIYSRYFPYLYHDIFRDTYTKLSKLSNASLSHNGGSAVPFDQFGQPLGKAYEKSRDLDHLLAYIKDIQIPWHLFLQSEMSAKHGDIVQDCYRCLLRIIKFSIRNNIRPILYTPPFFYTYTTLYDQESMAMMKSLMKNIEEEYGIKYFDFSTDEKFIFKASYFRDGDHLNKLGASKFSTYFKEQIESTVDGLQVALK